VGSVDRFPYSSSVGGDVLHLVSEKRLVFLRINPGQHEHCRRVAEALELL
jgi:hypothetical protein